MTPEQHQNLKQIVQDSNSNFKKHSVVGLKSQAMIIFSLASLRILRSSASSLPSLMPFLYLMSSIDLADRFYSAFNVDKRESRIPHAVSYLLLGICFNAIIQLMRVGYSKSLSDPIVLLFAGSFFIRNFAGPKFGNISDKHIVLSEQQRTLLAGVGSEDIEPIVREVLPECNVRYGSLFAKAINQKLGNQEPLDNHENPQGYGAQPLIARR